MTTWNYFLLWLEQHDKLAAWGQLLAAAITLFATFLTANMPIWAQRQERKEYQTQLEGALLAICWRLGGNLKGAINQIADPAERDIVMHHEATVLREVDQAISDLATFPRLELVDPKVRVRLDQLQSEVRKIRHNISTTLNAARGQRDLSSSWIDLIQRNYDELNSAIDTLARAVGEASAKRDPRNPVIHTHPDA